MVVICARGVIAAFLVAATTAGTPLRRATNDRLYVTDEDGTREFAYEKGLALGEARRILEQVKARCRPAHDVVRLPGRTGLLLVAGQGCRPDTQKDMGPRLMLVEKAGAGIKVLAEGRGTGDAYSLQPVVFTGDGRTIVLAELAAEYSWGLQVYEVVGSELRALGSIDAGVPGNEGAADEQDPTPFARVRIEDGKVVVTFDRDLVIGTGNPDSKIASKPVVFRQGSKGFVLERPRLKPRAPPGL